MADKTYKMTVTLSDGNTVDAGTFVAPQGPQGPAGELGSWESGNTSTFVFQPNSVYIVNIGGIAGLCTTKDDKTGNLSIINADSLGIVIYGIQINSAGKMSSNATIYTITSNVTSEVISIADTEFKYVKII